MWFWGRWGFEWQVSQYISIYDVAEVLKGSGEDRSCLSYNIYLLRRFGLVAKHKDPIRAKNSIFKAYMKFAMEIDSVWFT